MYWEVFLASLGGPAILLAAMIFFSKSLVKQLLQKDLDQFKNSLRMAAFEHEIVFSRLHDRRVEIIAELYSLLKDVLFKAQNFSNPLGYTGDPTREEKRKIFSDALNKFSEQFEKNKIWLDESLCNEVQKLYKELIAPAREMILAELLSEDGDHDAKRKKYTTWFEAHQKYENEVPRAVILLENEFRKVLYVTK